MITIREIADDNTSISSTRWAFAMVIKVDVYCVIGIIVAGLIGHFIGKPLESSFYASAGTLLGIITGLVAGPKVLQGFEPKKDKPHESETPTNKKEEEKVKEEDR